MKEQMTIGTLAKMSNVTVETIRFYERKNILQQPQKAGAFRYYSISDVSRIQFIKRTQALGFTLSEVKELLELNANEAAQCSDVMIKTEEKISEIDQKIKDLKKIKKSLKELAGCCEDKSISLRDCPVVACFSHNEDKK